MRLLYLATALLPLLIISTFDPDETYQALDPALSLLRRASSAHPLPSSNNKEGDVLLCWEWTEPRPLRSFLPTLPYYMLYFALDSAERWFGTLPSPSLFVRLLNGAILSGIMMAAKRLGREEGIVGGGRGVDLALFGNWFMVYAGGRSYSNTLVSVIMEPNFT